MIRRITIHNVGVFENATAPQDLKHLVLVYAENASGKTTLAEVLRALETGDPSIILKKRKFGTQSGQHVTLECEGDQSKVTFQNGSWGPKQPYVRVFDEAFVNDNVYSGLDVGPKHRRRLHNLTLGKRGADLSRRRDKLSGEIDRHNKDMKKAEDSVSEDQRRNLAMDKFCDIPKVADIEAQLESARMDLEAVQDSDTTLNTCAFERIVLPTFDMPAINLILQCGLENLDTEAAARVSNHIESLGEDGESWIARGVEYMAGNVKNCPFCGRDVTGASMMEHYRVYFSEAYARLKDDIKTMLDGVRSAHLNHIQTAFERTVGANKDVGHVWSKYGLELPEIDTAAVTIAWTSALDEVAGALEAKLAAPLERRSLDSSVVEPYERYSRRVEDINDQIDAHNAKIRKKKKMVESTTITSIHDRLDRLEIAKERYSSATAAWCDMYTQARTGKQEANAEKADVTRQLEKYRNEAFPALESGVNHYLGDFGVRFTIRGFRAANIGSGSTCSYSVRVDSSSISTSKSRSDDSPSIGGTLSSSDRNTLALAFFLSSLDVDENLAKTTVVVDDPVSSFDDNRSLATVQALRKLSKKVGQMIVLSHKASFLDKIWRGIGNRTDREKCLPLRIDHGGTGSTILDWEIGRESNAEQAQRRRILMAYAKDKTGDVREVLETIRPYLEAVLEALYADHYNASIQIGSFLNECDTKIGKENQIMDKATIDELNYILEYAHPSKHGSGQDPEEREINREQLHNYVKKTLDITGISVN